MSDGKREESSGAISMPEWSASGCPCPACVNLRAYYGTDKKVPENSPVLESKPNRKVSELEQWYRGQEEMLRQRRIDETVKEVVTGSGGKGEVATGDAVHTPKPDYQSMPHGVDWGKTPEIPQSPRIDSMSVESILNYLEGKHGIILGQPKITSEGFKPEYYPTAYVNAKSQIDDMDIQSIVEYLTRRYGVKVNVFEDSQSFSKKTSAPNFPIKMFNARNNIDPYAGDVSNFNPDSFAPAVKEPSRVEGWIQDIDREWYELEMNIHHLLDKIRPALAPSSPTAVDCAPKSPIDTTSMSDLEVNLRGIRERIKQYREVIAETVARVTL